MIHRHKGRPQKWETTPEARLVSRLPRSIPGVAAASVALATLFASTPTWAQTPVQTTPVPAPSPAPQTPPAPPSTTPQEPASPTPANGPVNPSPQVATIAQIPITIKADFTIRFDNTSRSTLQTGLIPTDDEGSLRQRVRLFFLSPITYQADAVLGFSTGTTGTPTVPFATYGDGFRGKSFTLARAYFTYYLTKTVSPTTPAILLGKMDNPFWRSQVGQNTPASGIPNFVLPNWSSEVVWDNDVTPEGAALHLPLFRNTKQRVKVTNTSAFYQINIPSRRTFTGLTSDTYLLTTQFHADAGPLQLALTYLDFHGLNSGLYAPIFEPGFGIDQGTGTSAFLLRGDLGFQATNAHYAYQSSVFGFGKDRFQVINPTIQILPHTRLAGGTIQPFGVFEYLRNTSVDFLKTGRSYTIGLNKGTNKRDNYAGWVTYRDVDADATLATIADSDLGAGTDYKGWNVGAIYHPQDNLLIRASYYDFKGAPIKTDRIQRFFLDVAKLF